MEQLRGGESKHEVSPRKMMWKDAIHFKEGTEFELSQEMRNQFVASQKKHDDELSGWWGPLKISLLDYMYTIRAISMMDSQPIIKSEKAIEPPKELRKSHTFNDRSPTSNRTTRKSNRKSVSFSSSSDLEEVFASESPSEGSDWSEFEASVGKLSLKIPERSDSIGEIIFPEDEEGETTRENQMQRMREIEWEKVMMANGSEREENIKNYPSKTQSDGSLLKKLMELHYIEEAIGLNGTDLEPH